MNWPAEFYVGLIRPQMRMRISQNKKRNDMIDLLTEALTEQSAFNDVEVNHPQLTTFRRQSSPWESQFNFLYFKQLLIGGAMVFFQQICTAEPWPKLVVLVLVKNQNNYFWPLFSCASLLSRARCSPYRAYLLTT